MGTFAHHPDLAKAFFSFNGHILYGTTLSMRQREILVLRLAVLRHSPYLWAQHLVHKKEAGLSEDDVTRIAFGPEAPFLSPHEKGMLEAVDDLVAVGSIADVTWRQLEAEFSVEQILDLIFTVGCYEMVAWVCNSFNFDLEHDLGILNAK